MDAGIPNRPGSAVTPPATTASGRGLSCTSTHACCHISHITALAYALPPECSAEAATPPGAYHGTNHVLPTYGYARNYSSLGLADFMRRYTVQELSYQGLKNIGNAIMDLADAEGLDAHRQAVALRLKGKTS